MPLLNIDKSSQIYSPFQKDYVLRENIKGRYLVRIEFPNVLYFADDKLNYAFPFLEPAENHPLACLVEANGSFLAYGDFDLAKFKFMPVSSEYNNFGMEVIAGFNLGSAVTLPNAGFTYLFPFLLS